MTVSPDSAPAIFVVDDDASVRRSLSNLFRSAGFEVKLFRSAAEMLKDPNPSRAACLVLDVRLPELSGLDLQGELAKAGINLQIVFVTGYGDIAMTVQAMKAGAVDFLTKPFGRREMLTAVNSAIERGRAMRKINETMARLRGLLDTLTSRERQVMALVTAGLMNKRVAAEVGLSEITVKVHRRHVMEKMGARSLAELVRMAELLGIRDVPL